MHVIVGFKRDIREALQITNRVYHAIGGFLLILQFEKQRNTGSELLRQKQHTSIKIQPIKLWGVISYPCRDANSRLTKPAFYQGMGW